MTDDELRAAAERLTAGDYPAGFDGLPLMVLDAKLVAAAYLAGHRADDGEPATPDWCREVGLVYFHDGRGKVRWLEYADGVDLLVGETVALRLPTRGQVRRLCGAMGVSLTEETR